MLNDKSKFSPSVFGILKLKSGDSSISVSDFSSLTLVGIIEEICDVVNLFSSIGIVTSSLEIRLALPAFFSANFAFSCLSSSSSSAIFASILRTISSTSNPPAFFEASGALVGFWLAKGLNPVSTGLDEPPVILLSMFVTFSSFFLSTNCFILNV